MTTPATLNDLTARLAPHRKAETETTGEFLKRRLISHAGSVVEEPSMKPQAIVAICELTGDDPIPLIFDELDCGLTWSESLRGHFYDETRTQLAGTRLDVMVSQVDRYREEVSINKRFFFARLDGDLRRLAGRKVKRVVVRQPRVSSVQGCPS
jgi:hypothetical protein